MENHNRQVLLKQRPTGAPPPADFTIADAPLPDPTEGEVLVRGIYLSLDPYMRGRISGQRSYARPVEVGAVIEGRVVGEVARSRDPAFRPGDYVLGGLAGSFTARCRGLVFSSSIRPVRRCRPHLACSGCRGSPPISGSTRLASRSAARPLWYRRPRGRLVPSSASLPNAPAPGSSALPGAPTSAVGSRPNSA